MIFHACGGLFSLAKAICIVSEQWQDYEDDEKPLPEDLGEMAPPIREDD